ncbi:DUF1800 domain-containing protein [Cocleimonas sp. KMM 6892]|uniref:DUF1800 domain-containing protein n=1 Tax=unclassified Cocleimonas TaxID=2639732 RepID=UPI002DB94E3C|nr:MULTISPECIES: DUF1800 domain-containing protein [unclassified Cocleimonas]MEB8431329.1 DUF1800 domain-containing protein [Cocleimonas sp. KMM 6892]MEC4713899.1 DUF1800 domain-containing protein [Cocleimonas sp. KMM 6895]MEC4743230.1 DUF1800 domain-containing protein [Cocleimonas sp. KMM 6896]
MGRLSFSDTRHLVTRTALGQEWGGVKALEGKTRAEAISILLSPSAIKTPPAPRLTPWANVNRMRMRNGAGKKQARKMMMREGERLKRWWMLHLLQTDTPVNEHMTLFWHNHFTSSLEKVEQPNLMLNQNKLLRDNAMGNFRTLLHKVARDPAMLIYLDGSENVKGSPNENFARELLELFTLGRGHYTENDIKAAAIAFTGWGVNRTNGTYVYDARQHDTRPVTFMGRRGSFSGDQIIDIILEKPRTAEYIAEKFWKEFVSDIQPDHRYIRNWGAAFRKSNYNIRTLFSEVLNSEPFWSPRYKGTLTKSPIDLLVGTLRALPFPKLPDTELVHISQLLGQDLFDPPTVKGWAGGNDWIDTQTLLVRTSLLNKLTRHSQASAKVQSYLPKTTGSEVVQWLLPLAPVLPLPTTPGKRRMVRALILDPVFQLK